MSFRSGPEGLYQSLHPLSFTLDFNLSLELPQSIIQIHPSEVHLIQNTAVDRHHRQCRPPVRKRPQTSEVLDSREDVLVELLPASQKLSNHLSAQSFSLQDEPSDAHWCVGHKAPLYQVLDPLFWLPVVGI